MDATSGNDGRLQQSGPPRANRAKRRLAAGGVATVVAGHSMSGDSIDFLGPLGFDAVWLEAEHGPADWERLGDLSRACDLWGLSALMRLRRLDPSLVGRALTLGVHGIVIPQVNCAGEARSLVDAAKFAPVGHRGVSRGRRSYGSPDFLARDNDETLLVVQLEDPDALGNCEEIAAVEHLDVVFIAPNDLAQAMGYQGQPDHPDVVAAIEEGLTRIAAVGGAVSGTLCKGGAVPRLVELGARFLYVSYDAWIVQASAEWLRGLRNAEG
jgi:2-keto-3-deoxy-L-rhamnonate aldolase RhmA